MEAENGRDGLTKALTFQPDLVLIDLVMPGMDGLETTRVLRNVPQIRQGKIVAISANVAQNTKQEVLAAGCDEFLVKPVHLSNVFDVIAGQLQLEWISESRSEASSHQQTEKNVEKSERTEYAEGESAIVLPPRAEMDTLYKLVVGGDITGLHTHLDSIEQLHKYCRPFIEKIRGLVNQYHIEQIRDLVQHYLEEK
jgi:CheY-like chemotaxis protein